MNTRKQLLLWMACVLAAMTISVSLVSAQDSIVIMLPGDSGNVVDWNTDPILAAVEAATNTEIEIINEPWETFVDQVNAGIASGDVPDIIGVIDHNNRTVISQWIRDGVLAPFSGDAAAAAPNIVARYEMNPTLAELKVDGEIYGVPISWGDANYPNMGLIHVRGDLLEKYGMEAPDTFEQYFAYLNACVEDGFSGVVFSASGGVGPALNSFAGAYGAPIVGWAQSEGGYQYWATQPAIGDALTLFRQMVADGLVDPISWEADGDQARTQYVSGQACAFIFNGGGHIGRIQNDMALINPDAREMVLPALSAGMESRGYSTEPQFWGTSFITQMEGNNPVAAARVLDFLASEEGLRLTAIGVEGIDYVEEDGQIVLQAVRAERGFPAEAGDTGSHPLAATVVSWVPQTWQDFSLLYGKDETFKDWYAEQWANQGMYQVGSYGLLSTSPLWTDFQSTSNELINRSFLGIVQSSSEEEARQMFDQFVSEWLSAGGEAAAEEMSALLTGIYGS
jgi:putative aldouronate transport system substrate-binding protein